jgi:hypothetical protein
MVSKQVYFSLTYLRILSPNLRFTFFLEAAKVGIELPRLGQKN